MTPPSIAARRSVTAFRHRNYRLFFGGQAISLIGTWMQQVAQGWLVLQVSGGNPLWLGVVAAAQFVPVMILGLFAGVLADSLPKHQTGRSQHGQDHGQGHHHDLDGEQGLAMIQKGIAKGQLKRPDEARLRLGMAQQLSPKNKASANQTLRSVKGTDGAAEVARLWTLIGNG